ncbi:MAG: hypothetical protein M3Z04_13600 [Chloroflexota bacterium]|nr:hypothetical protein [Chloroflexota bacterium]
MPHPASCYHAACRRPLAAIHRHLHVARFALHVLWIALLLAWLPAPHAVATDAPRYYAATGHTLAGQFTAFYDRYGGLAVFGYPLDEAHSEGGYLVQYTERERLEYHPENAGGPYAVLLGRLGADLTAGRHEGPFAAGVAPSYLTGDTLYVPQTGQQIGGAFLAYWRAHGGVILFGYPISGEFVEDGLRRQWFERARFEWHPELPAAFQVSLGLLGREVQAQQGVPPAEVSISAGPTTPRRVQIGLAQGGESHDPAFLHNAVAPLQALHLPLIRIDNLYTSYHVVTRDGNGQLVYHWDELDTVVDDIRATGAQPLMCLSYTPPALSPDGSPIQPPPLTDWQALVTATVRHFNTDRKLGIRYWEVWNESDQWDFWRGSWPDYLDLYDATRLAVRAADPQALVGGPARSHFDAGAMEWFLDHQLQVSDGGVDFLSWHTYGQPLAEVADQIRTARNLLAAHPQFHAELIISEFNVATGGAGDTSAGHLSDTAGGAAYVLSLLDIMDKEGLDRALLFEAKDGDNAASYWGRWGVVTHDGRTKPMYYALQAWQALGTDRLPLTVAGPAGVGALAATPDGQGHGLVWNTSDTAVRLHITLPPTWAAAHYRVTLFDSLHNNPAASGDSTVTPFATRAAGDLVFLLPPGSVLLFQAE